MRLNLFLFAVLLVAFIFEGWVLAVVAAGVAVVLFVTLTGLLARFLLWLFSDRDLLDPFRPRR